MPDRCCVYLCSAGYDSDRKYRDANNLPQLSQFKAPKGMLETWEKIISRGGGFVMKQTHTVCEKHFLPSSFVKSTPLDVNGNDITPRGRPLLLPSAIPTVLEGYPMYKLPSMSTKRKPPSERREPEMKRKILENAEADEEMIENSRNLEVDEENLLLDRPFTLQDFINHEPDIISRPNSSWHIQLGPTFATFFHVNNEVIQIDRYVKFVKGEIQPEVVLMGINVAHDTIPGSIQAIEELLKKVNDFILCSGTGVKNIRSEKCSIFGVASGSQQPRCTHCFHKRYTIFKAEGHKAASQQRRVKSLLKKYNKLKSMSQKLSIRDKKIATLQAKMEDLVGKCSNLEKTKVEEYVQNLPPCWRLAILTVVQASKAKSTNGRRYTTNWVYECALLRIKSLGLYKQMLRDNFLPVPSLSQLQRYMRKMKPAYGFNVNTFAMMKEKAHHLSEAKRHGSLLIDEMKLMEGIHFDKYLLKVTGLAMYGKDSNGVNLTPEQLRDIPADHALVFMFQGFQDQYFQSLSAHLSKGAVKGQDLAKLVLEAVSLVERSGFFVDVIITDAATWNRNMWRQFGIQKKAFETEDAKNKWAEDGILDKDYENEDDNLEPTNPIKRNTYQSQINKKGRTGLNQPERANESSKDYTSCVQHPIDSNRKLWFGSDFPHLAKSMKQRVLNAEELETPDGTVKLNHWVLVFKEDEKKGIKIAPKLSMSHFQTESYAAMNVKNAFQFFGEQCATGMEHYRHLGVPGLEDCASTVAFIRRVNLVIDTMNSNTRKMGLKAPNAEDFVEQLPLICNECNKTHAENTHMNKKSPRKILEDFLEYLESWETSGVRRNKRLTASTAFGLRVSIQTALDLSNYLIDTVGYEYFMTRRMNQDALEHFFGKIRQGCGAHGHPDPIQFIQVFRLLSFRSLVKPPRGSNVEGGDMSESLLSLPDAFSDEQRRRQLQLEKELDEALDTGEIVQCAFSDHTYYENQNVDLAALRNFGGYVARRTRKFSCARKCDDCFLALKAPDNQPLGQDDDIIHSRSAGYLIIPSNSLMGIIEKVEMAVLKVFQSSNLHEDLIFEVANQVKKNEYEEVGCETHKRELTKNIISFYLNTRMIFACEEYNRRLSESAHKKSKARQQQKMFRLTC